MPVSCSNNSKPRYRVKKTDKGNVRLAFCGDKVVEASKLKKKALNK